MSKTYRKDKFGRKMDERSAKHIYHYKKDPDYEKLILPRKNKKLWELDESEMEG